MFTNTLTPNCADYSFQLRQHMDNVRPILTSHHTKRRDDTCYVNPRLKTYSRVLLKRMNKHSLQKNYTGPHEIASQDNYFTIRLSNGTKDNVTVDRLKACITLEEALPPPARLAYHEVMIYPNDQVDPDEPPPLLQPRPQQVLIDEPAPVAGPLMPASSFGSPGSPAETTTKTYSSSSASSPSTTSTRISSPYTTSTPSSTTSISTNPLYKL